MAHATKVKRRVPEVARAVWTIDRFGEMLGLNLGYLFIVFALAPDLSTVADKIGILAVFFGAVILMKAQASVIDALHEADVDAENPFKAHVSQALATLGRENAMVLFSLQLTGSLVLWSYLAFQTKDPLFLVAGTVSNVLAITYSYPPRFKERGILNHVVTTGVDAFCVLLPGTVLAVGELGLREVVVIGVVFAYIFAIHVMHQSGDTYYDWKCGVETFTQHLGVENSVVVSFVGAGLATVATICSGLFLSGAVLVAFDAKLQRILAATIGKSCREQSNVVSRRFDVSTWAPTLNLVVALDLLVLGGFF